MGSAVFIPVAQVVFQNKLLKALRDVVPTVNPLEVVAAGANKDAIASFPTEVVPGILKSYAKALNYSSVIGVPLAGVSLLVAIFMPWFRYHNEAQAAKSNEENTSAEEVEVDINVHAENKEATVMENSERRKNEENKLARSSQHDKTS